MTEFLNSNFLIAIITFVAGLLALVIYVLQRKRAKRDAAKVILQEIRRAEELIAQYKKFRQYSFTQKLIANNSWARNIHYFVNDLSQNELDKISNAYSTGEYLDSLIQKISDFKFDQSVGRVQSGQNLSQSVQEQKNITGNPSPQSQFPVVIQLFAPWQELLNEVTMNYEPIYHSAIGLKLRIIARTK